TATNHLCQAGADDVVFQHDIVFQVFVFTASERFEVTQQGGDSRVKFQLAPQLKQHAVIESAHHPVFHISQQVIEVYGVLGDPCAAPCIVFRERVDLFPETLFVDAIMAKQGGLHITRDQGFIKIPDHRDL